MLQLASKCLALDILHVQQTMGTAAPELTYSGNALVRKGTLQPLGSFNMVIAFAGQVWNTA